MVLAPGIYNLVGQELVEKRSLFFLPILLFSIVGSIFSVVAFTTSNTQASVAAIVVGACWTLHFAQTCVVYLIQ